MSGYGNMIEIRHADGYTTRYAHNQANLVKEGDRVEQGQVIALLGSSGRATGAHVHFEVRKDGDPVDPSEFIGKEG
jgi:murein DD-endopeptidase MepM/ murein hydrolase activator NlpD